MRDFEGQVLAHDNVDFHIVLLSSVVRTAGVDLLDARIVRDDKVDELADKILGGRLSDKQPDVVESVCGPREEDQETDKDGTDRVDIPDDAATDNRHGETKGVDDDVVTVVDKKDMDGRVATIDETVDAEGAFAENSSSNKGNRNDVKLLRVGFTTTQSSAGFDLVDCQQLLDLGIGRYLQSTGWPQSSSNNKT